MEQGQYSARSAAAAAAVQAVLAGADVIEAYRRQGIVVPPVGTPVGVPIAPWALKAGDVGMFKDHAVMALGPGQALVSGQVQPIDSVSSRADFLGWFDPTHANLRPQLQ